MESLNNLSLLISSYDKCSDLWENHVKLLNKNWPDHPQNTIIVTDEKRSMDLDNVSIFAAGQGKEMPERIHDALSEIDTEYILLTLDDYFVIKPVENEKIKALLDFMDRENVDYVRLYDIPKEKERVAGQDKMYWVDLDNPYGYGVNLYAGIWRKSFLEKTYTGALSAWQYEVVLSKIAKQVGAKCALSKRHEFQILDVVRKGKILHKAKRYLKRNGYDIGDRPTISYKTELKLFVIGRGKRILPKSVGLKVKTVMRKCGYHFYSDDIQSTAPVIKDETKGYH